MCGRKGETLRTGVIGSEGKGGTGSGEKHNMQNKIIVNGGRFHYI